MQILIWGDVMKQKISICILFAFSIAVLLGMQSREEKEKLGQEISTEAIENVKETILEKKIEEHKEFLLLIEDKKVVVYRLPDLSFYMNTGIEQAKLSTNMKEELKTGIYLSDEKELLSFLENYSS